MSQHLITTPPGCAPCHRCGRLRLIGIAEGIPYRVEPAPLNVHGELRARTSGRWTYTVIAGQLVYRNVHRIGGDTRRGRPIVFAQHECSNPATEEDIETKHLTHATRLIHATTPDKKTATSETDEDALFLLSTELNGRVIAVHNTPPF